MKSNQAFTLIELLVVVLIIGILAAIAVPQYQKAVLKSQFIQAKILAQNIADAEEVYYLSNGNYTLNLNDLDIHIPMPNFSICHDSPNKYKGYCYDKGQIFIVNGFSDLSEVQYSIYKNGEEFLQYAISLSKSTKTLERDFKQACIAYGPNRKPISSDANYQICQEETHDNSPKDWGAYSLRWDYSK